MTTSWKPRRGKKRYDRAGAVVLNRVTLGQAPVPLRRIRWMHRGLWILLVLVVVGGGVGLWLSMDSRFYIYEADIVGNRRLSREEIFEASGLRGLHILWAHSGTIESRLLEARPSLESAEINCQLPSACTISVVERQPRVLWNENGTNWWIDAEGSVFAGMGTVPAAGDAAAAATGSSSDAAGSGQAKGLNDAAAQWVITGPLPRDQDGNLDERVRVALSEIWESGRDLPTEFLYDPAHGLSFINDRGWRVILGRGSGIVGRLQVLDEVTAHLESRGVTPRYLDVRFPDAPYYAPAADQTSG